MTQLWESDRRSERPLTLARNWGCPCHGGGSQERSALVVRLVRRVTAHGAVVFLLNTHRVHTHTNVYIHTLRLNHLHNHLLSCSLFLLLPFSHFHTHRNAHTHTHTHTNTHKLAFPCKDVAWNYMHILEVYLDLSLTPLLTPTTVLIFVLTSIAKRNHKDTHTYPHQLTHPYRQSMQICKIVERGYQIMNPLPTIAGRWMARRVEIEFLDFITPFFCCIVILRNEVTSSRASPTGNQGTGVC